MTFLRNAIKKTNRNFLVMLGCILLWAGASNCKHNETPCDNETEMCNEAGMQRCASDNSSVEACIETASGHLEWITIQGCEPAGVCSSAGGEPVCMELETGDDDDDDETLHCGGQVVMSVNRLFSTAETMCFDIEYDYNPDDSSGVGCFKRIEYDNLTYILQAYEGPVDMPGDEVGVGIKLNPYDGPRVYNIPEQGSQHFGSINISLDDKEFLFLTESGLDCDVFVYEGEFSGTIICRSAPNSSGPGRYDITVTWTCRELCK